MSTWCERCALQYPALALLAGGFLHADWPEEYADVDEAVLAFAAGRPALAVKLPREVDDVLAEMFSEEQLEDLLVDHLGLAYRPVRPVTYARWLQEVSRRLQEMPARS